MSKHLAYGRVVGIASGLLTICAASVPVRAQPVFSKAGDGSFRTANMQGLHVGLGTDSYQTLQPFACPPAGQAPTIVSVVCIGTKSTAGEEYMHSLSFNVTANAADAAVVAAGGNIDKVGSYLGVQAFAGATPVDVWARNTTVWAAPGFVGGVAGEELDLNNYECDSCGNHSFFGYWLTGGGPYPNRAGIFITGANANAAYQWHYGVQCFAEVKDACLYDDSSNDGANPEIDFIRSTGNHTGVGVNLESGNFAGGAIGIAAGNRIWLDAPALKTSLLADTSGNVLLSANNFTLNNKITYGAFNSGGNHQSTALTLSSYGTGSSIMTPTGQLESATNNLAVVTTGGVLVRGDVACQDGTNMAAWTVSGMFLAKSGTLSHVGTDSISMTGSSSSVAAQWSVQFNIDTGNNAPTLSSVITSSAAATCTARIDLITVK